MNKCSNRGWTPNAPPSAVCNSPAQHKRVRSMQQQRRQRRPSSTNRSSSCPTQEALQIRSRTLGVPASCTRKRRSLSFRSQSGATEQSINSKFLLTMVHQQALLILRAAETLLTDVQPRWLRQHASQTLTS